MSIRDEVIRVIRQQTLVTDLATSKDIARKLEYAGVLAPEPRIDLDGWQEWGHKHGNNVSRENGMVTLVIPDDISRELTPAEARELALWLNAAADHAEVRSRADNLH